MKLERRTIPLELRASSADAAPIISGHSIVTGSDSVDLGGFIERIAPDAVIEFDDVVALFNHDNNYVLGRTTAGTLTLTRDDKGLLMECQPPETSWANDLMVSMRRGDISQQSFAFRVLPEGDTWQELPDGTLQRTLNHIKIFDVSVVTQPAYPATDASVRSAADILASCPLRQTNTQPSDIELLRLRLNLSAREL